LPEKKRKPIGNWPLFLVSVKLCASELNPGLLETRWIVSVVGKSVSVPFFSFILCWLAITFTCFGLLAPRNKTVLAVMVLCSLSVGSAVFVILELDGPLDGIIKVSPEPLRWALSQLNQ